MKTVEYTLCSHLKRDYIIALLTDLHGKVDEDIIKNLKQSKPDFICISGDLCNTSLLENQIVKDFLKECIQISKTFISLGNHDYLISKSDIDDLKAMGIFLLNDEYVRYGDLVIGGLTSAFYHKCEKYDPKAPMAIYPETRWLDDFEIQEGYKILLDHHPENYDIYTKKRNINLILSGHAHGGQVRLFGKGIYARSQGFFPKYDGGVYENKLVVSKGLSNTLPVPRLWNPTEIVFINLKGNIRCQ